MCMTLFQSTVSLQQSLLAKKAAPANYIFLENLLFESEAASAVDCASSCWKRPDCWSFTVTTTSLGTTCRGHAVWMTSANERILTATTSLWHLNLDWLERECSNNRECGVPLSECFAGKCLCSPGYYYSNSKDSCVEGCEEADLQSTFVAYPGYRIHLRNIVCTGMPREDCITVCGQHARVRTCDYLPLGGVLYCCLQPVTKLDFPSDWIVDPTSTSYQRTCV
ncbi:hypothetical protein V1264_011300 [Littorina saxatilis]|uniref:Apple domain-containing protein n=1 Tax=Littorina saxatilis TaxID=31220 RepID=A0AAN9BTW0_9CAEN